MLPYSGRLLANLLCGRFMSTIYFCSFRLPFQDNMRTALNRAFQQRRKSGKESAEQHGAAGADTTVGTAKSKQPRSTRKEGAV